MQAMSGTNLAAIETTTIVDKILLLETTITALKTLMVIDQLLAIEIEIRDHNAKAVTGLQMAMYRLTETIIIETLRSVINFLKK
jgi:hypothetical protein